MIAAVDALIEAHCAAASPATAATTRRSDHRVNRFWIARGNGQIGL